MDLPQALHPAIDAAARIAQRSALPTVLIDGLKPPHPVVFANDAFVEATKTPRESIMAQSVMTIIGESQGASVLSQFQTALAVGSSGNWQMRLRLKNTAWQSAVVYLSPICDAAGAVVGHSVNLAGPAMIGVSAHGKDGFETGIYDDAPGFIAISRGPSHTFIYANTSYRNFVNRDDLIGRGVAEALPEIAAEGFLTLLDEVYRTGVPFRGTSLPIRVLDPATGRLQQRWMNVVYQPVRDAQGAIIGLFCEGHDVTTLHHMNEALAELELKMIHVSRVNAMGTMAATLAHELNQPLTSINNYLAGVRPLDGAAPDVDRLCEAMEGIRQSSERASAIISHLRKLTRHRKPMREPFKLHDAVEECVRLMRCSYPECIVFENRVADDAIMIADRVKIQQVLINLLQNACEAMLDNQGELIVISAIQGPNDLTVCIADAGPGVPEGEREAIFSWTATSKDEGMGIGLSICRTIVELYRGTIWLEKSSPQGAEFRFSIPLPDDTQGDADFRRAVAN